MSNDVEVGDVEVRDVERELYEKFTTLGLLLKEIREQIETNKDYDEKKDESSVVPERYRLLVAPEICRFAKLLIPDIRQKLDEIIEVDNQIKKDKTCSLYVSKSQHGADVIDVKMNRCIEIKTSRITKFNPICNIMWPVPSVTYKDPSRRVFLDGIREKTKNGFAKYIIQNAKNITIVEYEFKSDFLCELFRRVKITQHTKNINHGCKQCNSCKSFHKLDKMSSMEKLFFLQNNSLSDDSWDVLLNQKINSDCRCLL